MKNIVKNNWLLFIIAMQPVLDIIAYFTFDERITSISFTIRSLFLLFVVIYSFFNVKDKKHLFLTLLPIGLFSFVHVLNSYRLSGMNLFDDIRYLILVMQMPIIAICLCFYVKENRNQTVKIENGFVISFSIIIISILLSILTNSYRTTYETFGITGWFTSPNTESMILCILSPFFLYYFSKKENYLYFIVVAVIFFMLYLNGTKACYYTLIIMLFTFVYLFTVKGHNKKKLMITIVWLLFSLMLFNISFTSTRLQDVDNLTKKNEVIVNKYSKYKTREEKIALLRSNYLYEQMINDFGEDRVYDEIGNSITAYNLSDTRLVKRIYAKIIFEDSDILTKLVGFNHYEIEKYGKDLENDITAIFYYYGYIGFTMYISFLLYFVYMAIKTIFRNPFVLTSKKFVTLSMILVLGIFGGEYSGALLRKSNANIYFALIIVLYYIFMSVKSRYKKLSNNKITFLLLHLGYGGIESATINTANALSDKYNIELVSFYNLKNNQTSKINKNINIKYLYNDSPNRDEFYDALRKHKYLKVLKEGFRAVKTLLMKKILVTKYIVDCDSKYIVSTRWEFNLLLSKYGKDETVKIAQEHHYHNNNKKYINKLKKYKRIDYLFALTKTLEEDYKKILVKNKHTKVVRVPNMLEYIPNKESTLDDKNIITISRLDEGKRNDEIIKAFSKINNKDWKLYIIGDGKEFDNLSKLIKQLDLEKQVILTGYKNKSEIEKYLLKSSIFLMASVSEGLPMVLLEAMSYGVPCIAYETASGTNDIIKDNINGYVIKNRNEEEYIEKLEKVMSNKDLRKKLGNNAKNTSKDFSKEEILKIWYKILNENQDKKM